MYQAKIVSTGDDRYHATTSHGRFDMASDRTSSTPTEALLASLCACLGHYVADYLHQQQIQFSTYSVSAESDLAADRSRLGDIHVAVTVADIAMDEATKAAMLQYVTRCHIYGTLRANSAVRIDVVTSGACSRKATCC